MNESSLHKKLKILFSPENAKIECEVCGFVCDILCEDGRIREVQTCNFKNMKKKLSILTKEHLVEIIYPISIDTYIKTLTIDGAIKSYRKSPVHGSHFQILKELSGIRHLIKEKNLKLRLLFIESITTKIDDKKGRSRYKNPRVIEKELIKIRDEEYYDSIWEAILKILSFFPNKFTSQDIASMGCNKNCSYIIWFLKSLKLIEEVGKLGRQKVYSKTLNKDIN